MAIPVIRQDQQGFDLTDPKQVEAARQEIGVKQDPISAALESKGIIPDRPTPEAATDVRQQIRTAPTGTGAGRLRTSREAAMEEEIDTTISQEFDEREASIKGQLDNPNATDAEKGEIMKTLADLEQEKRSRRKQIKSEGRRQEEVAGLQPFTEGTQQDLQDRISSEKQRVERMGQFAYEDFNQSEAAESFYTNRNKMYDVMTKDDASAVVSNRARPSDQHNSSAMGMLIKSSGINNDMLHANNSFLALAKTMMTSLGKSETADGIDLDDAGEINLENLAEDINGWELPSTAWKRKTDPETGKEKPYVALEDIYSLVGGNMKEAARRQGYEYNMSSPELGQEITHQAIKAGLIDLKQEPDESGVSRTKAVFNPEFSVASAKAGEVLLPKILKLAPTIPGTTGGFRGTIQEEIKFEKSRTATHDDVVSDGALMATINMEKVPMMVRAPEFSFVQAVQFIANNNEATTYNPRGHMQVEGIEYKFINQEGREVRQTTPVEGTPEQQEVIRKARKLMHLNKTGKALEQNAIRNGYSQRTVANRIGQTIYPRFSIGNNSERKYNMTRDANPTLYKDQRAMIRSSTPTAIRPIENFRVPQTDEAVINIIRNPTSKADKRYMNFLYTIGSVLAPGTKGSPVEVMQNAQASMASWAQDGAILAREFLTQSTDLKDLSLARQGAGTNVDPAQISPEARKVIEKIINVADDGDYGYRFTALIDAYLHQQAKEQGGHFPSLTVGQLDLTAAGLAFMAKDAGQLDLLEQMGVVIPLDGEGKPIDPEGPRDVYMNMTTENIGKVLSSFGNDSLSNQLRSAFIAQMADTTEQGRKKAKDFIKDWGKPPMMVTPYGKHPGTHQGTVVKFLSKYPEFKEKVQQIYAAEGKNFQEMVEDLAGIHAESLKNLFGDFNHMYAISAVNDIFAIGGKSLQFRGPSGALMNFGADTVRFDDTAMSIDGMNVPLVEEVGVLDVMARSNTKQMEYVKDDGSVDTRTFVPDFMTMGKDSPLAALGHNRESFLLDHVINDVAGPLSQPSPFMANMYDSLSFDSASALDVWYGMNVSAPNEAFKWDPRQTLFEAAKKQIDETTKYLRNLTEADLSYPNGNAAALGFRLDTQYVQYMNQVAKARMEGRKVSETVLKKGQLFDMLAKDSRFGWSKPELIDDPNLGLIAGQRLGKRQVLKEKNGRRMPPISGENAAGLFNIYQKLANIRPTIQKFAEDEKRLNKLKVTEFNLKSMRGKPSYFAKPIGS